MFICSCVWLDNEEKKWNIYDKYANFANFSGSGHLCVCMMTTRSKPRKREREQQQQQQPFSWQVNIFHFWWNFSLFCFHFISFFWHSKLFTVNFIFLFWQFMIKGKFCSIFFWSVNLFLVDLGAIDTNTHTHTHNTAMTQSSCPSYKCGCFFHCFFCCCCLLNYGQWWLYHDHYRPLAWWYSLLKVMPMNFAE